MKEMNNSSILPVVIKDVLTSEQIQKLKTVDAKSFGFDCFIALLNGIPTVGGIIANGLNNIKATLQSYKENDFFRKFLFLVYHIKDTPVNDRNEFMKEVEKNAKDFSGSVIAGMIDRIDNINKAIVLANLMKARMEEKIDIEDFFRLSNVIERIPYTDFKYLKKFEENRYLKGGITEILYSTGALLQTLVSGDDNNDNLYSLSDIGIKLLEYGLNTPVKKKDCHGTRIPAISPKDIDKMIADKNIITYK